MQDHSSYKLTNLIYISLIYSPIHKFCWLHNYKCENCDKNKVFIKIENVEEVKTKVKAVEEVLTEEDEIVEEVIVIQATPNEEQDSGAGMKIPSNSISTDTTMDISITTNM